jgi:transgelin
MIVDPCGHDSLVVFASTQWIEAVTETPFPSGVSFIEALKDGVLLCTLANCIRPGIIKKVNKPGMPFREMVPNSACLPGGVPHAGCVVCTPQENVSAFLQAARAMAVPEFDLFSTPDLYEGKGPFQVVKCIHALGRTLQATMPDYSGPKLGVKMAEARVLCSGTSVACGVEVDAVFLL